MADDKPNINWDADDAGFDEANKHQEDQEDNEQEEYDMTPSQLNVRIPAYLHKRLRRHKLDEDENMEQAVTNALRAYLDGYVES
jgi:predicted HicB family RNase H-like nuclease